MDVSQYLANNLTVVVVGHFVSLYAAAAPTSFKAAVLVAATAASSATAGLWLVLWPRRLSNGSRTGRPA